VKGWLLYFACVAVVIGCRTSTSFACAVLLVALVYTARRWWFGMTAATVPLAKTMTRSQRRRLARERLDLNTAHRGRWS
jgi:hypothetical protein